MGVLAACGESTPDPAGHYQAVSESEWTLDLYLDEKGIARIRLQWWEAGSDDISATEYYGTWLISGDEITLAYDGITDVLQFSEDQSFREFGCNGLGPGVRGIRSTSESSVFEETALWRSETLEAISDPC